MDSVTTFYFKSMGSNQHIDNVIFDLGGVLYRINYWETFRQLGVLLNSDIDKHNIPDIINKAVRDYNAGLIRTETFLWKLQNYAKGRTPLPQKLIQAWNAMLLGWEEGIFEWLELLRKDFKLYLFSNINDLHYRYLIKEWNLQGSGKVLGDYFDGMAFSHLVNQVKPDTAAFGYVLNLFELDPERTLFIDDFPENVNGAIESGLKATCHDNVKSIKDCFFSYIELVC